MVVYKLYFNLVRQFVRIYILVLICKLPNLLLTCTEIGNGRSGGREAWPRQILWGENVQQRWHMEAWRKTIAVAESVGLMGLASSTGLGLPFLFL
jgi:hypothetical protein